MPNAFGRRNRSVHLAVTLILTSIIFGLLFYHPEPDRDAENFSTEGVHVKHQLTTPTPIVQSIEPVQPTREAIPTKHLHALEHIGPLSPVASTSSNGSLNKTAHSSDRTCLRPYEVKKKDTINFISSTQNVATLELLAENGLSVPLEGALVEGITLCLPETCLLVHVDSEQKCRDLAVEGRVDPKMLTLNPSAAKGLESGSLCHGLEEIGGVFICMSAPDKGFE